MTGGDRTVSPTGSYLIDVPRDAHEEIDGRVISYWKPDGDVLVQLSSYRRDEGDHVPALQRLEARLARDELVGATPESVTLPDCSDIAAVTGVDKQGTCWLYVYAVWKDLTVFASVSASTIDILQKSWGLDVIRSLQRPSSQLG